MEGLNLDNTNLIIYLACIIFIFIIGRIFIVPIKVLIKLIINSILGGVLIYIINIIGSGFNFHIGLNVFTAIFVGILGLPRKYTFDFIESGIWVIIFSYSTVTDFARFLG